MVVMLLSNPSKTHTHLTRAKKLSLQWAMVPYSNDDDINLIP